MNRLSHTINVLSKLLAFRDMNLSPKDQYRANLLRIIIYSNLFAIPFFMLYSIAGTVSNKIIGIVIAIPIILMNLWALRRLQQGRLTTVSRLIISIGWVSVAFISYGSGGLYSSGMMGMMALIVTAILLLDIKAGLVTYLATLAYFFVLLFIELSGNLPDAPFKDLPYRILVLSSTLTTLFLVINYHLYAFRQSEDKNVAFKVDAERFRVQRELTQDLAHDLRTPLSTLLASVYLIKRRQEKGLPIDEPLARLENQGKRLDSLIEDLFQMTLLDDSDTQSNLNLISVARLIHQSIADAESYARTRNIKLSFTNQSKDQERIIGERNQLKRALDNLIENAIHYGHENGSVDITLSANHSDVIIAVKDDGIGIARENYQKVFERFYRVDTARNAQAEQGSGIGLNAVQRIIQLHGGEVLLESVLGQGSTFTVRLPYISASQNGSNNHTKDSALLATSQS